MSTGAPVDQCSKCKTGISPQQATQTKKLFGAEYCANCIPDRKECCNCKAVVQEKQASFSQTAYGKVYCPDPKCQEFAEKEAQAAINAPEPPELIVLREQGWNFDTKNGAFTKEIDGKSVLIIYSDLAKKGGACMIAGKPFMPEDFPVITRELQTLFKKIDEAKGIIPKAELVRHERKPPVVAPANTKLSVETICRYLCPDATEEEAFMFLKLCKHRGLDPWVREAYLIKYDKNGPASTVVGIDAFLKRADMQKDFGGFEAGIILEDEKGEIIRREGTFRLKTEKLIGGWAKVYRANRKPYLSEVSLESCIKKTKEGNVTKFWASMPEIMIRKTPIARALREAYSGEFSGMYEASEIKEVLEEV